MVFYCSEDFAKRLQEEENRQAAIQHQQAERSAAKQSHDLYDQDRRQGRRRERSHSPPRERRRRDSSPSVSVNIFLGYMET